MGWAAFALAALVAGLSGAGSPARLPSSGVESSSPPLIWRDLSRLNILCLLNSDDADRQALQARLCERARALAAPGAPIPVRAIPIGDPAVLAADEATLLIHASTQPGGRDERLMAFSIRPFRVSAEQTAVLFGAAPRAVRLSAGDGELNRALDAALAEILPWRARPMAARPIPRPR